jgi:isoleucyl-tRNA synthetase
MESLGNAIPEDPLGNRECLVLVWTTTPWTLPASLAVAVHPELEYVFVPSGDKVYIMAKAMVGQVSVETGIVFEEPLLSVKGKELESARAVHPFYEDRKIPFALLIM